MPEPAQLCLVSEFVTPREAAQRFGVSLKTLRHWDAKGRIRSTRTPGGHRRYDIESVEGWRDLDRRRGVEDWACGLSSSSYQQTETGLRRRAELTAANPERRSAPTEAGRQIAENPELAVGDDGGKLQWRRDD